MLSEDGSTIEEFSIVHADSDDNSTTTITYSGRVIRVPTVDPGLFRRGDADGSGSVSAADATRVFDTIFAGGPDALDCLGQPFPDFADSADANDNEWLTIADFLAVRSAASSGDPLPAPFPDCGADPDDSERGFDVTDPNFIVTAGDVRVEPLTQSTDRSVFVPVLVDVPADVTGMTLILEFDGTNLTPYDLATDGTPAFTTDLGLSRVEVLPDRLILSVWSDDPDGVLLQGDAGAFQSVGEVVFHLADFAIVRPFLWSVETEHNGFTFRSTIADGDFADHNPDSAVGEFAFVRGNSNNDSEVDISDPVFSLNFLFLGGLRPVCLDAVDANNDSSLDITDPIFTLNFLFLGGRPIPPPYPQCGLDRGPVDLLGCSPCSCPPYPDGDPCAD